MSKVTKSERITQLEQIAADQARAFKIMADRLKSIEVESKWIIHMTGIERPQLKQLDQSVFDGLDEKWRFAAVDKCGEVWACTDKVFSTRDGVHLPSNNQDTLLVGQYDASNWQNSLIERDTAKEPLEIDLSSELTGSDLCRAMLARGDKYVMCFVHEFGDDRAIEDEASVAINFFNEYGFQTDSNQYNNAIPINNQGEPLTASEVGL